MKNNFARLATLTTTSLFIALTGCSSVAPSPQSTSSGTAAFVSGPLRASEVSALFDQWNRSLATGSAEAVAANYAPDSILIPTLSNKIRRTHAERVDYFEHFLAKKPVGKVDRANIRVVDNIALNSGLYTFTFEDGSKVGARYSFVYQKQKDGRWLIIDHHSSGLPE